MRRLLPTLALILLCGPAAALTLTVRAGEHAGFSRLVIPLPPGVEWNLLQHGTGAELSLNNTDILFLTDQIFERIPRNRIVALAQAGPGAPLAITLGCDCQVEAVLLEDRRLVIDVKDGSRQAQVPPARPHPGGTPELRFQAAETAVNAPSGITSLFRGATLQPAPDPQPATTETSTYPWAGADRRLPVLLDRRGNRFSSEPAKQLRENINLAVDRGLLEETTALSRHHRDNAPPGTTAAAPVGEAENLHENPARPGLSVENAIDRQLQEIRETLRRQEGEALCITDDRIAVQSWGSDDLDFATGIGAWQRRLYGEFDTVDAEAQLGLARGYLYFGFGAEAEATLQLTELPPAGSEVLSAMARLIDERPLTAPNPFSGQHVCNGPAALWAVLAAGERVSETDDDAVLRALGDLPRHLRRLFGPRLAGIYAEAGASEPAELSLRLSTEGGSSPDPRAALARSELRLKQGETPGQELTDLARSGREQAPEALIGVIRDAWAKGKALPPGTAELAAGYALQYRGSDLGLSLQAAHVRALALEGAFAPAFAELVRYLPPAGDGEAAPELRAGLLDLLTERAGDVEFLELLFANTGPESDPLPLATAEIVARRLLDLGFTAEAQDLLRRNVSDTPPDGIALIEAEIALALTRPHRALAILDGRQGAQAEMLRAQALLLIGDHAGAAAHFVEAGKPAEAVRSRWLAGEAGPTGGESAEETDGAGTYAAVARIVHTLEAGSEAQHPMTPIADAEMLLEQSQDAREGIAELFRTLSLEE